jgi:hypothetical protein
MITFDELKNVLLQREIEVESDNPLFVGEEYAELITGLYVEFNDAKTLLDLIRIYEDRGFDTYEANEIIINTLLQLATFNEMVDELLESFFELSK